MIPARQIRAIYDEHTIRVYQAYGNPIADSAMAAGRFVEPEFKMTRMTWIKPSFLWMMYRSGWARKDTGQCRVLAIDITRPGFEWALAHSCLSHPPGLSTEEARELMAAKPVRVQWDPERDINHAALSYRSLQVGLRGEAIRRYVDEWIVNITDITSDVHDMADQLAGGDPEAVLARLPVERPYPLDHALAQVIDAS